MLSLPTKPSSFLPTFSTEGTTYPIELIAGNWSGWLWFPEEFATHYNINWNLGSEGWRRFVGRGGGYAGGSQGVWTRLEPPREAITVRGAKDPSVEVKLAEGLYIHWFEEKHNGRTCLCFCPTHPRAYNWISLIQLGSKFSQKCLSFPLKRW